MRNNTHRSNRRKLSTLALAITSAIYINPSVQAQEDESDLEEIQVTGTRIRMTDGMAEPTPVTSLTPAELMTFEPGGTVAEQLSSLPQFFNVVTAQNATPGLFDTGGGSYLNMRGLNANRTLVLLDGSRVPPADKRGTVNVDNFPTALMRSVDVVTGGASAAYGADALGGVTNFVLDREFEGLKVEVSTGMNEFNKDGKNYNTSVAGGRKFGDRLHVIGSVETQTVDEIYRAATELDSEWYRRWGYVTNPAYKATDPPGTNPQRLVVPWVAPRQYNVSGVINGFPRGSTFNGMTFTDDGSNIRAFNAGDPQYNAANAAAVVGGSEVDTVMRSGNGIVGNGIEQRSGFVGAQYDVNDSLMLFGQALVGRVESLNLAEHTGYSMGNQGAQYYLPVYNTNPYIPAALRSAMTAANVTSFTVAKAGNYLGEYAPGSLEFTHTTFTTQSWQVGFDYTLPNDWNVRASWQSGETHKRADESPSARIDREALARDAVVDPATGAIVCNVQLKNPTPAQLAASPAIAGYFGKDGVTPLESPIGLDNSIRDCVPYNVMGAEGMSEAAWNYIHTPKSADSYVDQDFAELLLTGEAYEGWGYGPIAFATGLTYREQGFSDRALPVDVNTWGPPLNDPALNIRGIPPAFTAKGAAANLHQFSTIENISGSYDVWEAFGELQVPIWESESGDQSVGGNVAYRSSDYSSSGRSESWKVGLEVAVFADLRLRATRSRDVREAAFNERFDKSTIGANINNPWTGIVDVPTTASVGDPNLRPELADTIVAGFVYQPSWLDGFSLSTDWYEVDISDAISPLGAQQIVDNCFRANDMCDLVIGGKPSDGAGSTVIAKIFNPQMNLASAKVEGIDFETAYRMEPDFFGSEVESLSVRAIVGLLEEKSVTTPSGTYTDSVGGTLYPDYTGTLSANYGIGAWSMQWQQRFISESLFNTTWVEGRDIDDNTIAFYSWTNAMIRYRAEMENGGNWSVGFNINNLFDKAPANTNSLGGTGGQGTGTGDEYGRRYQLTLGVNF